MICLDTPRLSYEKKTDAVDILEFLRNMIHTQFLTIVKCIRTDNLCSTSTSFRSHIRTHTRARYDTYPLWVLVSIPKISKSCHFLSLYLNLYPFTCLSLCNITDNAKELCEGRIVALFHKYGICNKKAVQTHLNIIG